MPEELITRDPVCGMTVKPGNEAAAVSHAGKRYLFCATRCAQRFQADPESFLHGDHALTRRPAPAAHGVPCTCPMHPEIRKNGPGDCPICGMALEPVDAAAPADDSERRDISRRFWIAALCTLPLMVIAMGRMLLPEQFGRALSAQAAQWLELTLCVPVALWCAWPFYVRGVRSVRMLLPNMWTLISMGVSIAFLYSFVATIAPRIFPHAMRAHDGLVGVYFEAAAVIVTLVLLGQVLELRARRRAGSAIRELLELTPPVARRLDDDGAEREVSIGELHPGDRVRVRPGDRVPIDGVIIEGRSAVDESLLTGEAIPVQKSPGDQVTGGSMNGSGSFILRVTRTGAETTLAQIVQMVASAQRTRAPIQRVADTVAAWFAPAVILVAIIAFVCWLAVGPSPALGYAIIAAVSVLIIACPCALGLATPMSIMVSAGRGAKVGILIKDAASIEALERVDTLILDKTGTLTEGKPALVYARALDHADDHRIFAAIAAAERNSEHPLAQALVAGLDERSPLRLEAERFDSQSGLGIQSFVDGRRVVVGSAALMAREGVDIAPLAPEAEIRRAEGGTAIFAAIDGALAALLVVADAIRPSAANVLNQLRREKLDIIMLTGDNRATAQVIAAQLGITNVEADMLPQDKANVIRRLQTSGRVVAMAGDGVNDAPALAQADVGIAMGAGAGVAVESAGITLLGGDLAGLLRARRLSRATMRNVRQNLFFAFIYNAFGVPIAAGVLYPFLGILLSPMLAAAAMSLSSVSVIANALRLRAVRLDR